MRSKTDLLNLVSDWKDYWVTPATRLPAPGDVPEAIRVCLKPDLNHPLICDPYGNSGRARPRQDLVHNARSAHIRGLRGA